MASFPYRSCASVLTALLLGGALVGCAASAPAPLTAAARHDLQCEQVELSEAGRDRYAASGCGRGVLYAKSCGDKGCAWTRLPTGAEPPPPPASTAGGEQVGAAPAPPREIIQAPPPQQREVLPAPPPGDPQMRQVIPAPPPANAEAPGAPQSDAAPTDDAQQPYAAQQTPLTEGELSAPYQAEVPATPTVMRSEYPPPAPLVETRPPPPQPSYVWVTGYWWWNTPAWVWAPGYWCPPRYGFNYVPGSWYWSTGAWWYGPGGWARPGSTIIVDRVYSRPSRWTTTRSFRPYQHVTGYGYAPPGRVAPKSANYGYAGPTRSYAPSRGYAPSYGRAPATPGARVAPATGFSPGRYVSGNTRPDYTPSRATVGARGYGPAQAPRSFTPQQSPLYRYPTQLNNPMRAPARSSGATWGSAGGGGRERAPMTGFGYQGSRSGGSGGTYGGARVAPRSAPIQQAPVFRSAPIQTAPHDIARGRAYGAPASSFRGSAAPIRMPSSGGGGGGRSAPRGARVAPRR